MAKLLMKDENDIHKPTHCPNCNNELIFKGVGEYYCSKCRIYELDDYGKVRGFIEKRPGATSTEIEIGTGVSQKIIRELLRQSRIEISSGSAYFLKCEECGAQIKSGVFCEKCENIRRLHGTHK